MKRFLLFFLVLFSTTMYAQFSDNFSDGNFTQNPLWQGSDAKFVVNNSGQLQLNDNGATTGSNKAYLATQSQAIMSATWECSLSLKVVLTSANYVRFYLVSDTLDLSSSLNGYFVMLGGTTKEISLYRQNGLTITKLIDGNDNRLPAAAGYSVQLKVERSADGEWQLWSQLTADNQFVSEGTCRDKTLLKAAYSGLFFNYSSSNKANFACDSISAVGQPYIKPIQHVFKHDVVFTEIMADPDPVIHLPNTEFVEIYNRTDKPIDMAGWSLCVGDKCGTIIEGELLPHTFALLCASSKVTDFLTYGQVIPVSSFPAIPNSSALITLVSDEQKVVAWTDFSDAWYGDDAFKKAGGWSLERINVDYLDNFKDNWMPSQNNAGGTPSAPNSVSSNLSDQREPQLQYLAVLAPDTLLLQFSKSMDDSTLQSISNYQLEPFAIRSLVVNQPYATAVSLILDDSLAANEKALLHISNLKCVDNLLLDSLSLRVSLPQQVMAGDVVINEILFNPKADGVDYIEILNISDKVLDLSSLLVTKRKGDYFDVPVSITNRQALCFPGDYWVLTSDPTVVCKQFSCAPLAHFSEVAIPSMNDDEGSVVLVLRDGTVVDEFSYSAKMHHPFVIISEGVSLERVNPFRPTQAPDNWQSASFESGYGTPGSQNSQYSVPSITTENSLFWLEYDTFTPDNDGIQDLLHLNYQLTQDGFTVYADVFNANGVHQRQLLNGELVGMDGVITWNGLSDKGTLCDVGIYVLFVEAIHPSGSRIQKKMICVLSAR